MMVTMFSAFRGDYLGVPVYSEGFHTRFTSA